MNQSNEVLTYCLFCLQNPVLSLKKNLSCDVSSKINIFVKMLSRFVEGQEGKHVIDFGLNSLECCDECLNIVNKFCDLYHQYKCLELQLDWTICKIAYIVRSADKVPSRVSQAENTTMDVDIDGKEGWDLVAKLRDHVIAKCQLKLARSLPRLSLRKDVASLPVLFQPVFISSSNESLNVVVDTTIEEYSNLAECERSEDFEDGINTHHDFHTDNNITDQTNKTSITHNVEQVITSGEPVTTCILNSFTAAVPTSCLAIENVIATPPVYKLDPLDNEENQTKDSEKDHNTLTPPKKYNLRRKLPQKTTQQINDDDKYDQVNIKTIYPDNSSNVSTSSFSETSSESSSSEEHDCDTKPEKLSTIKIRKLGKKYNTRPKCQKNFNCKVCECRRTFRNKQMYENHLRLHCNGKLPCNFCSKVKPNLVQLANHEFEKHGKVTNQLSKKGKGWQCPRCPIKSSFRPDYEAHFAYSHFGVGVEPPQRRFFEKCKICNKSVWNLALASHFKSYHDTTKLVDKKFKRCVKTGCSAYFLQTWQLSSHYALEHKTEMERGSKPVTLQCHMCLRTFSRYLSLQRHKLHVHKYQLHINQKNQSSKNDHSELVVQQPEVVIEQGAIKQFKCKFCQVIKENPADLALHEAKKHAAEISENFKKSKKASCCPRCPYKYTMKRAYIKHHLHVHLNLLNQQSASACKLCSGGKVYKNNSERHFRTFHKICDGMEAHKCDKCPAYFRKPFQLQMHTIRVHQQDHQCEVCGKYLKFRTGLVNHMSKSHPGHDENPDFPLACDFIGGCKKRFGTQGELEHHEKYGHQKPPGWSWSVKNGNVRPKCDKCGQEFTGKCYLEAHLANVHGERPFVCDECGKAFKSKPQLDLHSDFHKRPEEWKWQCAECGKKCTTKQKLEEHGRTHTKEKPFICQFCGEKYAHRHNWRNHLTTKHGDEEDVVKMSGEKKKGNYLKRKGTKKGDCIIATK